MKKLLFWLSATVLFAAIGHVGYVLYSQLTLQSKIITKIAGDRPSNSLSLIASVRAKTMFAPLASPDISYGYCSYDITSRPIRIKVALPSTYWSLAAYSKNGINFFTINDQQVKTEKLEIVFASEKHRAQLEEGTTIVTPPTQTGLFLFRTFIPNRSLVEVVQAEMEKTSCTLL